MGVRECVNHELLSAYPVLQERSGDADQAMHLSVISYLLFSFLGDQVAHVKFTVLLLSGGTVKITGLEAPAGFASLDKQLPEDIAALLAEEDKKKKKKRGGKKKGGKAGGGAAEDEDEA